MIELENFILDSPSVYFNTSNMPDEVKSLLNCITRFFNQKNKVYFADLVLYDNKWETVKNKYGQTIGKRQKTTQFKLHALTEITVNEECIVFKLYNDEIYVVDYSKDFYYTIEWESEYYG